MTSPWTGAGVIRGGGATSREGVVGASDGRASAVVVGGFFLQALTKDSVPTSRNAKMIQRAGFVLILPLLRWLSAGTRKGAHRQTMNIAKAGLRSWHPDRLHVVGASLGQNLLVPSVDRVHRVDLGAAPPAALIDD